MNSYDNTLEGRIEPERKLELPFSAGDAADCIMIKMVRKERLWVVMISETAGGIRASIFSFDSVSNGKDRSYRGFCVYRRLRGRPKHSVKTGTRS